MTKTKNTFGHYVLSADKGKTLTNGEIYTKSYISVEDINEAEWTEVNDADVPVVEELTETEEKAAAYDVLMGVSE